MLYYNNKQTILNKYSGYFDVLTQVNYNYNIIQKSFPKMIEMYLNILYM